MLKILQWWIYFRSSLWFLPGLIVLMLAGLALVLIEVDILVGREAFERWPRLFGSSADGARSLLATVASSMVTVVGVVFSITVVALALASSQYTSRVLRNFMRDRVTQGVLGMMVGAFAYCLLVLRSIRGGSTEAFIPSLATLGGICLAFVGIAALIYFIHHISTSIQAAHIVAAAAQDTLQTVDKLYPDVARDEQEQPSSQPSDAVWQKVPAAASGYLQTLDMKALMRLATERNTVIRLNYAVGDFVVEGSPILSLRGLGVAHHKTDSRDGRLYVLGVQRTNDQDVAFGIRQIVDTALKALSPGINDSTTAVMCIQRLSAILYRLGERQIPTVFRDDKGEVRVVLPGPTYASFLDDSFAQICRNAAGNVSVLETLVGAIQLLAERVALPERRAVLREHVQAIARVATRSIPDKDDLQRLEAKIAQVDASLAPEETRDRAGG